MFTQYEFRTLRELIIKNVTIATFDELSTSLYKAEISEILPFGELPKQYKG